MAEFKFKYLTLQSIRCITHSSGAGNDDVYFRVLSDWDKSWKWIPRDPGLQNSWDIDEDSNIQLQPKSKLQNGNEVEGKILAFIFDKHIRVEIWDYDSISGDDYLGGHDFYYTDHSGGKTFSSVSENSEYYIEYKITDVTIIV
ncbi:hypothetical protein [Nostoc sp. CCY0012]|uniref:hypothetical protein n=1 Tax=Nostoc sp. CCY0012 TaxID=1056123 RepID=UPI0039C75A33